MPDNEMVFFFLNIIFHFGKELEQLLRVCTDVTCPNICILSSKTKILNKIVKGMGACPSCAFLRLTSAISTFLSHILMVFSRSPFMAFCLTYSITGGARNSDSCFRSCLFRASALARSWVGKDQLNLGIPGLLDYWGLAALTSLPVSVRF